MDLGEKDKYGTDKRSADPMNFHPSNLSSDWRFGANNLSSPFPSENSVPVSSSCSGLSMANSFYPSLWDPSTQNLPFNETSSCTSNIVATRRLDTPSKSDMDKALEGGWNPPNPMPRGVFLQPGVGFLPQSLSQFQTDSGFIERAARFSCFSGGNLGDIMNPFGVVEPLDPFAKTSGIQNPEVGPSNCVQAVSAPQLERKELHADHGVTEGSPMKNESENGSFLRPPDDGKDGVGVSNNESDEADLTGSGQEEPSNMEHSTREPLNRRQGAKKRKRNSQDAEMDQVRGDLRSSAEAGKENKENKQHGEQTSTPSTPNPSGKNGKESSQNVDAPKEDYIHVRARRGQATNSHSLAERVRREKISERMKFLQDLVPGCSKVTGKAVMLDEIINYVQSLQRQVEFLSMKLAAVNPRLDLNLEGLLSKDTFQSRSNSSGPGFPLDISMPHPQMHPTQQGLIPAGIPGMAVNHSDALRRTINPQIAALTGYRDQTGQMPSIWDDELNNVVQMSFGGNVPYNAQQTNGSLPSGHMKVEL